MVMLLFEQGDVIEFDFSPSKGHEPAGRRPGLVVSNSDFQKSTSMTLVCPITTTNNSFPLHMPIPSDVDEVFGCVVLEQVRAFDLKARNAKLLVSLDRDSDFVRDAASVLKSFF